MKQALLHSGFIVARTKGSHHFMIDPNDHSRWATIPIHSGETLNIKCIQAILKSAKITPKELKNIL